MPAPNRTLRGNHLAAWEEAAGEPRRQRRYHAVKRPASLAGAARAQRPSASGSTSLYACAEQNFTACLANALGQRARRVIGSRRA